tara:strand:+ start:596 stop:1000 length:405 start_codon:yes stop_codon:yes gene_type:complete
MLILNIIKYFNNIYINNLNNNNINFYIIKYIIKMKYIIYNEDEELDLSNSILFFSAGFCSPCKKIEPVVKKIFEDNDDIKIYKINIENMDDYPEEINDYDVKSIPYFVYVKNNEKKKTYQGTNCLNIENLIENE